MAVSESHYTFLKLSPSASRDAIHAAITQQTKQANKLALTNPEQSYALRERLRQIKEDLLASDEVRAAYDTSLRSSGSTRRARQTRAATSRAQAPEATQPGPLTPIESLVAGLRTTIRAIDEEEAGIQNRLNAPQNSEAELDAQLQTADAQIAAVIRSESSIREFLEQRGVGALLESSTAPLRATPSGADPARELGSCLTTVDTLQRSLTTDVQRPLMRLSSGRMWGGGLVLLCILAISVGAVSPVGGVLAGIGVLCVLGVLSLAQSNKRRRCTEEGQKLMWAAADARFWHGLLARSVAEKRRETRTTQPALEAALRALAQKRVQAASKFEAEVRESSRRLTVGCLPWDDPLWQSWTPSEHIGPAIRIGKTALRIGDRSASIPLLMQFPGPRGILIEAPGSARKLALLALQSAVLRVLAVSPPGTLQLHLADPAGMGQNVSPFVRLAEFDTSLVIGCVSAEATHIEQTLANAVQHIRHTARQCAEAACPSIEDYNNRTPTQRVPYRLVVLAGIPPLAASALSLLEQIVTRGPACGVYAYIVTEHEELATRVRADHRIEQRLMVIRWDGQRFVMVTGQEEPSAVIPDTPPPYALFNHILEEIGQATLTADST